jgi:hypothetical protein
MEIFEIKISKKTRVHFKIFGQNRIQKFKVTHPTKFDEVKNSVETKKKRKSLDFVENRSVSHSPSLTLLCHLCPLSARDIRINAHQLPRLE